MPTGQCHGSSSTPCLSLLQLVRPDGVCVHVEGMQVPHFAGELGVRHRSCATGEQRPGCRVLQERSPRGSRRDMTPWGQCWGDPGCSVPLQIDFCCGNSLRLGPSCCWVGRRGSFWEQRCGAAPSLPDTPARVSGSCGSAGTAPTRVTLAGSRAGGGGVSSHPELLLLVLSLWSTKRR